LILFQLLSKSKAKEFLPDVLFAPILCSRRKLLAEVLLNLDGMEDFLLEA
jgi:hypothetical protein